mmetsp:Transcript_35462/g.54504  ORF Transcript_35462/g.54504 Transcript_35462/m.54504 type:complete len:244 (-) Transcript_35462:94-825(-)
MMIMMLIAVLFSIQIDSVNSWTASNRMDRRCITKRLMESTIALPLLLLTTPSSPLLAATTTTPIDDDVQKIIDGRDTLKVLLENWERATVDCTYADVPRELLEQKNKDLLLEKASTFALFDKSTSIETCKTTNKVVRNYLGVNGKGPLVGINKILIKPNVLDAVNADDPDAYFTAVESLGQALSRALSLSYTAGSADFTSVNNFAKGEDYVNDNSNLEQARRAIQDAKTAMDTIVSMLPSPTN